MRRAGRLLSRAGVRLVFCVILAGGLFLLALVGMGILLGHLIAELESRR